MVCSQQLGQPISHSPCHISGPWHCLGLSASPTLSQWLALQLASQVHQGEQLVPLNAGAVLAWHAYRVGWLGQSTSAMVSLYHRANLAGPGTGRDCLLARCISEAGTGAGLRGVIG